MFTRLAWWMRAKNDLVMMALMPRNIGESAACSRLEPWPYVGAAHHKAAVLHARPSGEGRVQRREAVLGDRRDIGPQRGDLVAARDDVLGGDIVAGL